MLAERLALRLPDDHAATPDRDEDVPLSRGYRVAPGLVHQSVRDVVDLPVVARDVVAAETGRGSHPDLVPRGRNAVDHVVGEAAVELGEDVDAAAAEPRQPAHRADPEVPGSRAHRQRRHHREGKAFLDPEDADRAVLEQGQTLLRARPDPLAIDRYRQDLLRGKARTGAEGLPAGEEGIRAAP